MKPNYGNRRTKIVRTGSWMLITMFSVLGTNVFSKEWNGIVPCVSARRDAEKILHKNSFPTNLNIYRLGKSRVHVRYRENKDDPNQDVVERIDVFPNKSQRLAKYISNVPNFETDFRKSELDDKISHVYGLAVYRNWTEGFEIWVQKNEEDVEVITRFGYFDPAYSCSKILPALPAPKK